MLLFQTGKMEGQAIFLNLFSVCLLYKQKFVVWLFNDIETDRSYPLTNGLNRLDHQ